MAASKIPTAEEAISEAEKLLADMNAKVDTLEATQPAQRRTITPLLVAYLLSLSSLLTGIAISGATQDFTGALVASLITLCFLTFGMIMEAMDR